MKVRFFITILPLKVTFMMRRTFRRPGEGRAGVGRGSGVGRARVGRGSGGGRAGSNKRDATTSRLQTRSPSLPDCVNIYQDTHAQIGQRNTSVAGEITGLV